MSSPPASRARRLVVIAVLVAAAGGLGWWLFAPRPTTAAKKVTIGIQTSPAMATVMVAKDKGMFAAEGLDVELQQFTAGKFALQAFVGKSLDFSVSGEVPVCLASLQGNDIRVVAQVVERTVREVRVVARTDGPVTDPAAYFKSKKRKLATSFGGGPEFFTYNFLKKHGIRNPEDVEVLNQKPEDMTAALESGSVDAISVFDPFAYIAEKRLAGKVSTFASDDLYSELYVLNVHPEQLTADADRITAVLKALAAAADYIEKNPDEAQQVVAGYTKLDRDTLRGIWGSFVFRPALTPQLVEYWTAQAAWAKATNKAPADAVVPDFRARIADGPLRAVRPAAVTLP